jgi:hypothetical protein
VIHIQDPINAFERIERHITLVLKPRRSQLLFLDLERALGNSCSIHAITPR